MNATRTLPALALVAGLLGSGPVLPDERDALSFPRKRVVVLPVRDYRIDPEALFPATPRARAEDRPSEGASITGDLDDAILLALRAEPELDAVRADEALASGREGRGNVALGFLRLGVELYRNLRVDDAAQTLEKGVEAGRTEYLDLVNPQRMFDLYLYLGLSYVEQGRAALAHVAFKNMFLVAPREAFGRAEFRRGYFPAAAEDAIRTAAVDFVQTSPQEVPLGSPERTADLLKATGAKAIVDVFVASRPGDNGVLSVRVFEPVSGERGARPALSRKHPVPGASRAGDLVSRDLSAWIACTDLPSRAPPRERLPRFYMDTTGTYTLFLRYPTRNVFHNAGFGAGLSYQILKELDFFVRLNLLTSFPDKYNDLISGFTSIRFHTGVGYTLGGTWGRFFVHTGLDLQYLTNFASSTDPSCKIGAWTSNPEFCNPDHVERLPYRFLGGAGVAIGVDVILVGPIYVTFKVGAATYFFPAGPASPLNFPLVGEAGLGYAFF